MPQRRPYCLKQRRKHAFVWTKKRLRTENRLLRQRIDYLEHESSALADRLVRGQVDLAQQADNCLSISHELHVLRDINSDAHRRLEEAYETVRQLSSGNKPENSITDTATQVDDTSMIEHIHQLQQELIEAHTKKSDLESAVRELKLRVQEVESANKRLRESPPDGGVASLQEELIRVKMREAEAALSLKEMRQRIAELETHWMRYQEVRAKETQSPTTPNASTESPNTSTDSNSSSANPLSARNRLAKLTAGWMGSSTTSDSEPNLKELEEQLMGLRIREADMNVELQEMRQKVMELETQNHVCSNQLKRQDEELKRVTEERDELCKSEQEMGTKVKELEHKLLAAESEMKEKNVMQRLKYTEALQNISDLKQHIAQLESKNAEKFATAQLRGLIDMDEDSIASNRSNGSLGDATSINSEEMSAFLAEVTLRHSLSNVQTNSDSLLEETDEEDERGDEKKKKQLKSQRKHHEDTADSGLDGVHLSDN
uniref:GRIP domain-containing protein n=1 Tax=Bursaphelenchus xylophilus TaxID=6326 RepID=A0A1I7S0M8_BURXY